MDSKKLYIGEFNDSFMPVMDGVGNVVKNYTIEMNKLGHEAYAIVPGYKEASDFDKINHIDYTIRGKEYYPLKQVKPYGITTFPKEAKERINSIPFDIVHAHCPTFTGKLALNIAKKRNIPLISTFHTFFKDDVAEFMPKLLTEKVINIGMKFYYHCDEVWTPSLGSKKKIIEEYHFTGPIRVVENGCDMVPPKDEATYAQMRQEGLSTIGVEDGVPVFIYVGQHKDEKNIPLTLNAMKALKARGERFKMVFVGEGHSKENYEKFVKENALEDCVTFLGKITDRNKVASLYCASTAFLFPSLYDTSCLVMREAAAFKLPLVYVDVACTSEGITDGENGFIIKNDIEDYANKLQYIISHPEVQKHAGAGARRDLYRSWHDAISEVESLYYQIIDKKKSQKY
jgi:1,2-diacylglycerol 3-alpha-glucosyltransferase